MKVLRLWLGSLVAWAAVAVLPSPAYACSCVEPKPPQKAVQDFDAVFAGTVTAIEDRRAGVRLQSSADPINYNFEVDAVARGDVRGTVVVSSSRSEVSCGVRFREGARYLVFAYHGSEGRRSGDAADPLVTNICTPTTEVGAREALPVEAQAVDDPGDEPPLDSPGGTGLLPVAALVAIVVAALFWLKLRPAR